MILFNEFATMQYIWLGVDQGNFAELIEGAEEIQAYQSWAMQ
jgi:hypothetical protein